MAQTAWLVVTIQAEYSSKTFASISCLVDESQSYQPSSTLSVGETSTDIKECSCCFRRRLFFTNTVLLIDVAVSAMIENEQED